MADYTLITGAARSARRLWGVSLLRGVLSVAAGVVVMVWPGLTVALFVWVVAVWALAAGLLGTVAALRARSRKDPGWDWRLAVALITLVLGVVVVTRTGALAETLALIVALYLLASGIVLLVAGLSARDRAKALTAAS